MLPLSEEDRQWILAKLRDEHARLRGFIRCLGVRPESVDDFAHDAILVAISKFDTFDKRLDFGAWVREIARRLIANARRKESRREKILLQRVAEILSDLDRIPLEPAVSAERKEELSILRDCYSQLSTAGQELLRLRYFEQLTPGMIATRLGKPSQQIRQMLLRFRRKILACIRSRFAGSSGLVT